MEGERSKTQQTGRSLIRCDYDRSKSYLVSTLPITEGEQENNTIIPYNGVFVQP